MRNFKWMNSFKCNDKYCNSCLQMGDEKKSAYHSKAELHFLGNVIDNSGGCIDLYCEEHGYGSEISENAKNEALKQQALDAGFPLSVIEGRIKLSDLFSKEYIDCISRRSKNG